MRLTDDSAVWSRIFCQISRGRKKKVVRAFAVESFKVGEADSFREKFGVEAAICATDVFSKDIACGGEESNVEGAFFVEDSTGLGGRVSKFLVIDEKKMHHLQY